MGLIIISDHSEGYACRYIIYNAADTRFILLDPPYCVVDMLEGVPDPTHWSSATMLGDKMTSAIQESLFLLLLRLFHLLSRSHLFFFLFVSLDTKLRCDGNTSRTCLYFWSCESLFSHVMNREEGLLMDDTVFCYINCWILFNTDRIAFPA